jgi:O-acetyl-ADP-ribose deacetylase (regulator of RNase III)
MTDRVLAVGNSSITLRFGDITSSRAQVLVSSDDYLLSMSGGVSAALSYAGGFALREHARKVAPCRLGDIAVTTAGDLSASYIFHAITIGPHGVGTSDASVIIRTATLRAMALLSRLECNSIAFPLIGSGTARMPPEVVASEMAGALFEVLLDDPRSFKVEIYLRDGSFGHTREQLTEIIGLFAAQRFTHPHSAATQESSDRPNGLADERADEVFQIIRRLDARRQYLESKLVDALTLGDDQGLTELEAKLTSITTLRRQFTEQLHESPGDSTTGVSETRTSVFVSSTSRDLANYRSRVRQTLEEIGRIFVGMEDFTPEATSPAEMIRRRVAESEVYLGVLGMRYGFVDSATGMSMTELEYQQALASNKPLHIFVMDKTAPITADMVELDPENLVKLNEFKSRVLTQHSCGLFTDAEDLAQQVRRSLLQNSH